MQGADLVVTLEYIWRRDCSFENEGDRIQMALCIQLLAFTGARPGEIIESRAHVFTGASLKYRDTRLVLLFEGPGSAQAKFFLLISNRLQKHRRDKDPNKA